MTILVTGATSGLGRNAVEWLRARQLSVRATGRDIEAGRMLQRLGADFHPLDLDTARDEEIHQLVQGCDAVWHCAARSAPWGPKAAFMLTNAAVTKRLALAAGQSGVPRFIHISTPAIYFDFTHRLNVSETFRATRFANHYAHSKFMAEEHVTHSQQAFPDTRFTILRPRGLFGPHDRVILPRVLTQIRHHRGVLRLPRGGDAVLDLTFSLNAVEAMWQATAATALPPAAIYNVTNHEPRPLKQMLHQLIGEHMAQPFSIKRMPYRLLHGIAAGMETIATVSGREPMLTRYSVGAVNFDMTLSSERAIQELGYHPVHSLDEGIALTAQAWQRGEHRYG